GLRWCINHQTQASAQLTLNFLARSFITASPLQAQKAPLTEVNAAANCGAAHQRVNCGVLSSGNNTQRLPHAATNAANNISNVSTES
ncbi:MAG: hypothetical protein MUR21_07160, partial [OM182 bacterium]|nr:hypothetical protein [OM182 bacterium]